MSEKINVTSSNENIEKVYIESSNTVKVELNDSGFYIEFNPLDMDMPLRIEKASKDLKKISDKLQQEILIIEKREDVQDGLFTRNTKEKLLKLREYNTECGKVVDELFGEGTSKHAFGNRNYFGMYNDLFDSLQPIIQKVYGNPDTVIDHIKHKYSKEDSDVLR